ncbi:hypothetical protein A4A49_05325 [Nicotiana attenuata]|uniref:Uncharacterized protein n=1 Tax=Nicotiana attenuata TaxID=49451 RepID=A0A1J6I1W1_NICAT|nr:hypothetical protein A4A49_05325 [Nicotiana attenuata]
MATKVMRPQDSLIQRFRTPPPVFHRRKKDYANGIIYYANQKPAVRTERSIRSSRTEELRPSHRASKTDNGLVMGQVTILRRGDSLDSIIRKDDKNESV